MRGMVRTFGWVLTAATLLAVPVGAQAAPRTTVERTIQDTNGDQLLDWAPGDPYVVRTWGDAEPTIGPLGPDDADSLLNFLQLSDFQAVDEESPARVEFLDTTQRLPGSPLSAAYRPHEAMSTQIVEAMVRQARNTVSPVTGARLDLSILTGDNADSQQHNETRWFIDILDGDRTIVPDSGIPVPGCEATPGTRYDGVRGGGRAGYYEPDRSRGDTDDGDGYSPRIDENQRETGREVIVRDHPGLLEDAQEPFRAVGLGMPWYSAFGNHDALVQGNSSEAYFGPLDTAPETSNPAMEAIATGCVKVSNLPVAVARQVQNLVDEGQAGKAMALVQQMQEAGLGDTEIVPPDPARCHLAKDDPHAGSPPPCDGPGWIGQHFVTGGTPVGHGFAPSDPDACAAYPRSDACRTALSEDERQRGYGRPATAIAHHDGYYSFSPRTGVRFVVLDTISDECGAAELCSEGSVDNLQFEWLRSQIETAAGLGEYVLVFSHHTLKTIRQPTVDATEFPIHFGQLVDRRSPGNPQNPTGGIETLEQLYCQNPNVLAHVAGHEHASYVDGHECDGDFPPTPGPGRFWNISTAAHLDWPQQARTIELVDVGDGTLGLVLTMLDHGGPAYTGGPTDPDGGSGEAGEQVLRLASFARELAYNDYQADRSVRGTGADRNVILQDGRPVRCGAEEGCDS